MRLGYEFYYSDTRRLAREALGKKLVRVLDDGSRLESIIVETEAYLDQGDPASHSHRGPGKKNASMFGPAGTLYVYSIHAKHCANIVTEPQGRGAAVLIRAAEPIAGHRHMWMHRFACKPGSQPTKDSPSPHRLDVSTEINSSLQAEHSSNAMSQLPWPPAKTVQLTQGPGRLCQALDITRKHDGLCLTRSPHLWIEDEPQAVRERRWNIRSSQRIGIRQAQRRQLRFFIDGNRFVSGLARDHSLGRTWIFAEPSR